MAIVFIGIIVIRAEMHFEDDAIHYVAIGDSFTEIPEGSIAPEYEVILTKDDNNISVEWKRTARSDNHPQSAHFP